AADCPSISDTANATGDNVCFPNDPNCPKPDASADSGPQTCTLNVLCPHVTITKGVVCLANGLCDGSQTYSDNAYGVQGAADSTCPGDNGCPTFCYKVTVVNDGTVDFSDVKVSDTDPNCAKDIGALPSALSGQNSFT